MSKSVESRTAVFLGPSEGRTYSMGPIQAVFKADGAETNNAYTLSEWWLEPHTMGPGAHAHPEDGIFYVLEGTMSFLIGDQWVEGSQGSWSQAVCSTTLKTEVLSVRAC